MKQILVVCALLVFALPALGQIGKRISVERTKTDTLILGGTTITNYPIVNIKDWGARGTGVVDDGPAIQATIDAVGALGGGTVTVPQASVYYNITSTLNMKSGVRLVGSGSASWIKMATEATTILLCDSISDFSVEHLKLTGVSTGLGPGVAIAILGSSHDGLVQHNTIGASYIGVLVNGDTNSTALEKIKIVHNTIQGATLNGVGINTKGANIWVDENLIEDFGSASTLSLAGAGVEFRGVQRGSVFHNTIRHGFYTYVDGIRVEYYTEGTPQAVDRSTISKNIITGVTSSGIAALVPTNCEFSDNIIDSALFAAIYLNAGGATNAYGNTFSKNTLTRSYDGLRIEGTTTRSVYGNSFSGNTYYGMNRFGIVSIAYADNNTFVGEIIEHAGSHGIQWNGGHHNTFNDCTVRDCADSVITSAVLSDGSRFTTFVALKAYDTRGAGAQHAYGIQIGSDDTSATINGLIATGNTAPYLNQGLRTSVVNSIQSEDAFTSALWEGDIVSGAGKPLLDFNPTIHGTINYQGADSGAMFMNMAPDSGYDGGFTFYSGSVGAWSLFNGGASSGRNNQFTLYNGTLRGTDQWIAYPSGKTVFLDTVYALYGGLSGLSGRGGYGLQTRAWNDATGYSILEFSDSAGTTPKTQLYWVATDNSFRIYHNGADRLTFNASGDATASGNFYPANGVSLRFGFAAFAASTRVAVYLPGTEDTDVFVVNWQPLTELTSLPGGKVWAFTKTDSLVLLCDSVCSTQAAYEGPR